MPGHPISILLSNTKYQPCSCGLQDIPPCSDAMTNPLKKLETDHAMSKRTPSRADLYSSEELCQATKDYVHTTVNTAHRQPVGCHVRFPSHRLIYSRSKPASIRPESNTYAHYSLAPCSAESRCRDTYWDREYSSPTTTIASCSFCTIRSISCRCTMYGGEMMAKST